MGYNNLNRVLLHGVVYLVFNSLMYGVQMFAIQNLVVNRKVKRHWNQIILSLFLSMMGVNENMVEKFHFVLNLKKQFPVDSLHRNLHRQLIKIMLPLPPVYQVLHQWDQNSWVKRNMILLYFCLHNRSLDLVDPVPVVLLVVEGGPNTVRTGRNARCSSVIFIGYFV